jgi:hypothetical protein
MDGSRSLGVGMLEDDRILSLRRRMKNWDFF